VDCVLIPASDGACKLPADPGSGKARHTVCAAARLGQLPAAFGGRDACRRAASGQQIFRANPFDIAQRRTRERLTLGGQRPARAL
jgi:hypothetical protein